MTHLPASTSPDLEPTLRALRGGMAASLQRDDRLCRRNRRDRFEQPADDDNPVSLPELGIAYWVLNEVDHPVPDAPNEAASVPAGASDWSSTSSST